MERSAVREIGAAVVPSFDAMHERLENVADGIEQEFRSRSRLSSPSPKVWADAYLLAFAAVAGLKFITFDRSLKSRGSDVLVL